MRPKGYLVICKDYPSGLTIPLEAVCDGGVHGLDCLGYCALSFRPVTLGDCEKHTRAFPTDCRLLNPRMID